MQLPLILKGFNVFADGLNKYGVLMDVKRPKVAYKTEDYTPGGGLGEMTVIHGVEKLELELTSKGYDAELFKSMSHKISGNLLRYQGALHKEDEEDYTELVGEARGRIIEADPGEDKAGEGGEHKFKYALTYWKETVNGETVVEIDLLNNKFFIGGKDVRAGIRKALGLI
ncbi:MAG: phage major tail tube protein [Neisseria sp.]|nr:phage major tail tube protein [Neisseria sp.]